jgi:membrane-associated phospholipid phosphatase
MGAIGFNHQRPIYNNNNNKTNIGDIITNFDQLGMPSGHMEICTLYFSYLYHYAPNEKILGIPLLWLIFILRLITGWQRITSKRHTTLQVIGGFTTGWLLGKYLPGYILDKMNNNKSQ